MIKNISFLIFIFMSQLTYAKVVELDNHNIAHCQEQLENDSWDRNVVMLYVKDSPGTNKFRTVYEQVATERPKRNLFALNVFDPEANIKENKIILETVKGCLTDMWYRGEKYLGDINTKTPTVLLFNYAVAKVGVDTPVHHKLSTKEDILEFIGEKTPKK